MCYCYELARHLQRAARSENWRQIHAAIALLRAETDLLYTQFNVPWSQSA